MGEKRPADWSRAVELRDGQSFAIAGLMSSLNARNVEQVPWLASIPIIGALFSSKSFQQRDTELVVIVTPHLVKPAKPGQNLDSPLDTRVPSNDLDFFLSNKTQDVAKPRDPGKPDPLQRLIYAEGAVIGTYGHMVKHHNAD